VRTGGLGLEIARVALGRRWPAVMGFRWSVHGDTLSALPCDSSCCGRQSGDTADVAHASRGRDGPEQPQCRR